METNMDTGSQRSDVGENADWMAQLPDELLDVPLWDLAIPGSHDSMSYCLDVASPVLRSESCLLRLLDLLFPSCTRQCVYRWATTQVVSISEQCNAGVRFLDLRIANKIPDNKLYFSHAIYTLLTVKEALSDLATWLDHHPKEVVIVACSHFYKLDYNSHSRLISFITQLFRTKLCPAQETPTLRSCWSKGQQVIVSYDDSDMVHQHTQLWPDIPYWYADSPDPHKVIAYLEKQKMTGRPAGFFVSGLNLTEHAAFILCHPCWTMRKLTMSSLSLLLGWLGGQRPGPEPGSVNVVCCDFVGLSMFCSMVIQLNRKLEKPENQELC